jgi:hypothetical protein
MRAANRNKALGTKRFRQDWLGPACLEGDTERVRQAHCLPRVDENPGPG